MLTPDELLRLAGNVRAHDLETEISAATQAVLGYVQNELKRDPERETVAVRFGDYLVAGFRFWRGDETIAGVVKELEHAGYSVGIIKTWFSRCKLVISGWKARPATPAAGPYRKDAR